MLSLLLILNFTCTPNIIEAVVPRNHSEDYGVSIDDFALQVKNLLARTSKSEKNIKVDSQVSFYNEGKRGYSEFYTKRLLVKSKDKINTMNATAVVSGYKDLWVLQFETIEETALAFEYYNNLDKIEYVETDDIVSLDNITGVSKFNENGNNNPMSWGADIIGTNEAKEYLNNLTSSLCEIKVGIIDSGVDYEHEFLKNRLVDKGLNFSSSGEDNTAMSDDPDSHGTHIAGIIVDNTLDNVKLKGYKIFDSNGETSDLCVALAIDKAVEDKMDVLNMSFSSIYSETIEESLQTAYNSGIVLVSSAGNDAKNIAESLPANFKGTIAVAAANENCDVADFSNYGYQIDITAPGVNIYSTIDDNKYGYLSGTSMATPFVTACVSILLSLYPNITQEKVENVLKGSALPMEGGKCFVGDGMVNVAEAISFKNTNLPKISHEDGLYFEPISVSFFNTEQMEIFYTLDGTDPDKVNGTLYSDSFIVEKTSVLKWRVYYESESAFRSKTYVEEIKILPFEDEVNFEVDESGELIAYHGNKTDFSVPKIVKGVTVNSVGYDVFSNQKCPQIVNVMFPETIKVIGEYAFKNNQSIECVVANGVEVIETRAFDSCVSLKEISAPNIAEIQKYAFNKCYNLSNIKLESVENIGDYAFRLNKSLVDIKLDSLKKLGLNAFINSMIREIEFSVLETFQAYGEEWTSNALNGCDLLESLYFPELVTLGNIRKVSEGFNSLDNLTCFFAPKLKEIGNYAFYECTSLQSISIDSVECIGDEALYGCKRLSSLHLPMAKYIVFNVFNNSKIDFIYFEVLEETHSLPSSDSIIALPSTTSRIEGECGGAYLKIYGTKGTYAEEWANSEHKYCTSEFISLPLITGDLPLEISEDECKLTIDAVGFNLSYQWYGSIDGTIENSVILVGEDKEELVLENTEKFKGYYCVVNGEDGEFITSVKSNVALIKYNLADYTEYNAAIASVPAVLSIYIEESVAKLQDVLSIDVSNKLSYEQNVVDEQTRAILNAISSLELKSADYSQLDKVLETIPDDLSIYTDESLIVLNDVLDSIDKNVDITNQSQIDEWAKQVETTVKNLKIKPADYTVLDETISKIPDNLSLYTDESVAGLKELLKNIDRELDVTQQEQVDNYVTAVERAITNLNYKSADYSLVFDAIATIPEDLSIYSPESVDALDCVIESIDYSLDITQQEKVDEYATQIKQAVENLEEECWIVRLFREIMTFLSSILVNYRLPYNRHF